MTKRRVLIVEDNQDAGEMYRILIELYGHEALLAENGPRGLEILKSARPDIALVDIGLPGFDGYEVAAQVRSDPGCRHVRLVAMTGYGQPEDRRRALASGFDAHLVKPVRADELARILELEPVSA